MTGDLNLVMTRSFHGKILSLWNIKSTESTHPLVSSFKCPLLEDARAKGDGEYDRGVAEDDQVADGNHFEGYVAAQDHDSVADAVDGHPESEPVVLLVGETTN